jgi:cardiolipin synthase
MPGRHRSLLLLGPLVLAVVTASCAQVRPHLVLPQVAVGDPAFIPTVQAHAATPVVGGNRVEFLLNGEEIFPAMLAAIRGAQKTIAYAQYFYEDGPVAREMAEALVERCRAGVRAHILLDGFGTLFMPPEYRQTMEEAGCEVVTFRPLNPLNPFALRKANNRNHRRILVIDGRVGFTGGSGVSAKWMGDGRTKGHWRETDVRVEGPVVQSLQGAFAENWLEATGVVLGGEDYFPRAAEPRGSVLAQVVRSSPAGGSSAMYTMLLLAISSAQRSILITNPYFLPDERMVETLMETAQRGVRVVLLLPGPIDASLLREASRLEFGRLLRAGVEIHEYQPALLHAKTMVIDGAWATIGSANLDNRSLALNDELNLVLYDREVASRLEQIFHEDLAYSRRVERSPAWRRSMDWLLRLLAFPARDQF